MNWSLKKKLLLLYGTALFLIVSFLCVLGVKRQQRVLSQRVLENQDYQIKKDSKSVDARGGDKKEIEQNARLFFVGDVMLDRYIRTVSNRKGVEFLTDDVNNVFSKNDLTIANLEGPVTNEESLSSSSILGSRNNYIFTFDPKQTRDFLKFNNIGLVNVGNNHILNFREKGLADTKNFLKEENVSFFGDLKGKSGKSEIKVINGIKISFVSYNQFGGGGVESVLEEIEIANKDSDFVVVYAHWGTEYELKESESQQGKAHEFIDTGADLIIGSHPHVVQSIEMYKGRKIFYSLGNFVFDQYFSADTMIGLGVEVGVSRAEGLKFKPIAFQLTPDGKVNFAKENISKRLLKRIVDNQGEEMSLPK